MRNSDSLVMCIPVYGAFTYALATLTSFMSVGGPAATVVVVDDCSPGDHENFKRAVIAQVPSSRLVYLRNTVNRGLTYAWNFGFSVALDREAGLYAPGNSDILFAPHALRRLRTALTVTGATLAGPVTNAPGHVKQQNIRRYFPEYAPSDDPTKLAECEARLAVGPAIYNRLNGFFMVGDVTRLKACMYDGQQLYDPGKPLKGNEDELQTRMCKRGGTSVIVRDAFVFHYRSVSRGLVGTPSCEGAYRA